MRINLAAQVLSETEVTVLNNFAPETSGETGMFFIMMSKFLITWMLAILRNILSNENLFWNHVNLLMMSDLQG